MEMINLHIWDNLELMDIGDKAYLGKLEIIDKNKNTLVCSDSSNSPEYYDMKGYCLSGEDLNISSYEARYIFPGSSFSELTALMLELESDLNLLCQDRIRKLTICLVDSLIIRLPACISRHFKFSVDKGSNGKYTLEITIPNKLGSMFMNGFWTEELSFPIHPSDPLKILLYRGEFSKEENIDIHIEDVRATDWGKYNGRQF